MDLFEKIRDLLSCRYISDIRCGDNLVSAKKAVALLDLDVYPLSELKDMARYLYGGDYTDMSRNETVFFLKNYGVRGDKRQTAS